MNKRIKYSSKTELLCIGFLCHDLHEGKNILGGTASYSSIMASHLGISTALLTSVGSDFEFSSVFEKYQISIYNKLAKYTTVFENIYHGDKRTQYIHHRAKKMDAHDVPDEWYETPVVKFCLIADEVDLSLLQKFPNALVGATIQGWLRKWDDKGKVSPKEMDWDMLKYVDVVFMSNDDILGYEFAIPKIAELVKILIMTDGKNGAVVFHDGKKMEFPVYPTIEVDPTGAGDIFASSFLVKYYQTQNIMLSVAFAHAAASFIVEHSGIIIPESSAIEKRYKTYLKDISPF